MLLCSTPCFGGAGASLEEEFEDSAKTWQEIAHQLPPAPEDRNLLSFYVSPTATQRFAIDAQSLTVGSDGVIRYTMVATSTSGAKNISYEGIRCQSFEKKLYAFGHPDGSWSRARSAQWEPIRDSAGNRQHAALARDYFCQGRSVAGKSDQMLNRIKSNQPLSQ